MRNIPLENKNLNNSLSLNCTQRVKYIWIFLLSGIVFFLLSIVVHKDAFRIFDYDLLIFIQKNTPRNSDIPLSFFTLLGSTEIVSVIWSIVFLGIYIKLKKIFIAMWFYFLIFLIELVGKVIIFHPTVPSIFHRYALGLHFPSGSLVSTAYSFPSGHMARTAFMVFIIFFLFSWRVKNIQEKVTYTILLFLYLLGMFITRISLGEHWFSDVIGGTVLGLSIASLTFAFW